MSIFINFGVGARPFSTTFYPVSESPSKCCSRAGVRGKHRSDVLLKGDSVLYTDDYKSSSGTGAGVYGAQHLNVAKIILKDWTEQKKQDAWSSVDGLFHAKAFIKGPSQKSTKELRTFSRNNVRMCECWLACSQGTSTLKSTAAYYLEDETADHILCHCVELNRLRLAQFGQCRACPQDFREAPLGEIITFIMRTGLLSGEPVVGSSLRT